MIVRQETVRFLMMAVALDADRRRSVGGKIMTSLGTRLPLPKAIRRAPT